MPVGTQPLGVIALANAIPNMGALTSLDLSNNTIGRLVMSDGWQFDEDADEYWKEVDGEEIVETQIPAGEQLATESPVGAIAIANAVKDMGALSSLILKSNRLCTKEAGKALAEMLAANTVLTELDLSDNSGPGARDGPGFAQELAVGIRDNGALTKLILRDNSLVNEQGGKVLSTMLTTNSTLTELDVSDNWKGAGSDGPAKFAKELTVGLCDNGALTKLDISNNNIEQGEALERIADLCNTKGIKLNNHESKSEGDDGH
jgi:Leucine-rich repeat (LRR) protein